MIKKPFFSIIVPVYNVEKYIIRCVDSILCQSYTNFELIIIDDESPDDSISLVKKNFEDKRIKIFHKKNGGLSDARNYGLQKSEGNYIWFIDSDDYISDSNALSKLQKTITQHHILPETIVFNINVIFENTNRENMLIENAPENSGEYSGYDYIQKYNIFPYNAWAQCYKKSFLAENNFLFPINLYFEDIYLNLDIYKKAKYVLGIKETLYTYNRRSNSITGSQTNDKHIFSQAKVLAKVYKTYASNGLPLKYLSERILIEYDRTKNYYKSSQKNLDKELSVILKDIKIPTTKSDTTASKLEKKVFSFFPLTVLRNQVFFGKLRTLEKLTHHNIKS